MKPSPPRRPVTRYVLAGVGAFVAVDLAIIAWFESRPKPALEAPAPSAARPVVPQGTTSSPRAAASPSPGQPQAPRPRPSPSEAPRAPAAGDPTKEVPSPADLKAIGEALLSAVRANDEAYLKSLAPPGAEVDQTTVKMYSHERNVGLLREAAPRLDELAQKNGMSEIVVARGPGEARLKLYKADGQTSGKSLVLKRRDDGEWYIEQEVYMRDDR